WASAVTCSWGFPARSQKERDRVMHGQDRTTMSIQPNEIRYSKLGEGGTWAQRSFSERALFFGYRTIPHEVCEREDWKEVARLLSDRKSEGAKTAGVNEIRAFYEQGKDCLWITFADGHMWW